MFIKTVLAGVVLAALVFLGQSLFFTSPPPQQKMDQKNAPLKSSFAAHPIQPPSAADPHKEESVAQVHYRPRKGPVKIGGRFLLRDHKGGQRSNLDFRGRYMLVYFGYSFCPDICPTALYNMTEALEKLGDKAKEFQPLFITVDPERDTVDALAKYMENFHPSFVALTGTSHALEEAKKAYHVYAMKADPEDQTGDYVLDHSSIIYVMDRHGRYLTSYNHETPPEVLAKGLLTLF